MIFHEKIFISKKAAEYGEKLLTVEPKDESECFGENEPNIVYSTKFDNGYGIDIMICGVQYEENSSNTAWSQAILLYPCGQEVCCTETENYLLGEWELEDNEGNQYFVEVVKED